MTLDAVAEDAGAPVGAVGTLISGIVDLNPPAGGQDNVTDADAGPSTGAAIIDADTANGDWWYTTDNGAAWHPLGAVTSDAARVLAADADTRIYFEPDADYAGTIADAITFRAWDQTDGNPHGTAASIPSKMAAPPPTARPPTWRRSRSPTSMTHRSSASTAGRP